MKKLILAMLVALAAMSVAMAQDPNTPFPSPGTAPPLSQSPPTFNTALGADVLGAHNGYGRGCVMCHAPHGGAQGNAAPNGGSDTYNGNTALWGENLNPYYGQTVTFTVSPQGTTYSVTLPSANLLNNPSNNSGDTAVILCLSCHDGALTRPAMMQGQTVEALPIVGGTAPTLFGLTAGNSQLNYINEHPVGPIASVGAGTWGCTVGGGDTTTKLAGCGTAFFTFALTNYPASIWYAYANSNGASGYPLAKFTGTVNGVTCTTCHNQHSMTVYSNGSGSYPTMFFIKGEYWPYTGGNSVAQFCRNCHSGESNEMSGLMSVPTT